MQFEYSVDETPFRFVFSFETLIERMVNLAKTDSLYASKYGGILDEAKRYPELLHEVDYQYLAENHEFLKKLLDDIFPPSLTDNEIKAVSMPYANFLYNPTRRLVKILEGAGSDFELKFINISPDEFYIMCCCFILSAYFKTPVRADIPFIYSIPNAEGYLNHYRVLTNGDFLQIIPTENAKMLSKEEIAQLSDRFYDVELWKEKIPPHSWEVRGFGVVNFYDATTEVAISNLKGLHIKSQNIVSAIPEDLNETFRSIFRSSGIMVGCTEIDPNKKIAKESPINFAIDGYLLKSSDQPAIIDTDVIETLMRKQYFSISDIDRYLTEHPYSWVAQHFATLGFKSIILAPIFRDGQLISVIEVCSPKKFLNSVNAHKLDSILPFLEDSVNQVYTNLDNRIAAIIQREYTAIHPSVYWKFRQAAIKHLGYNLGNRIDQMPQQNISFHEVLPHYGQSDVKNSSEIRNKAILKDLTEQLTQLHSLLRSLEKSKIQQQLITKTEAKLQRLRGGLRADTENEIQRYLVKEVKPVLEKLKYESTTTNAKITAFLNADSSSSFRNRKRFDDSIGTVNKQLSDLVDRRQEEQQEKFPFYYERYTTDGVEHNLYIGKQIAPWLSFDPIYVKNLRLWQLRLMIECELHFQHIKRELPVELEITSLILAYHSEISIRFRLDEKRFDVDGSYNARYEIIKKRIDKALIKDTNERLVKSGYLSIVYAQQHQYQEYLQFLEILRDENLITGNPECLELESLQGITGLKALRIPINFSAEAVDYTFIEEF